LHARPCIALREGAVIQEEGIESHSQHRPINSEDKSEEKAHRWDETSLEGEWVKGSDK